eukprot:gene4096-5073_t
MLTAIAADKNPPLYVTHDFELKSLLDVVTLEERGVDVCCSEGSIQEYLKSERPALPPVINIDIVNRGGHVDQVEDILGCDLVHGAFYYLIYSPPFEQSDCFITWALRQNLCITCFHLSGGWDSIDYRHALILRLSNDGRLVKIRAGKHNIWIVVFKTAALMTKHVYRLDSSPAALEVPEPYSDPASFRSSHRSRSSSPVHYYRGSPEGTESDLRSPSPDSPSSIISRRNTFGEVDNREFAPPTDDPMHMHSVQLPPATALENRSARAYIDQPTRKSKTKETFIVPPINGIARKKGVAPPYDSGHSPQRTVSRNADPERVLVLGTDYKFRDISLRDVARGTPDRQVQSHGKKFKSTVKRYSRDTPDVVMVRVNIVR